MGKRWFVVVGLAIAILAVLAWQFGWAEREDPLIAQTRAVVETPREKQTPDQQTALRDAWRDRMQGMNDQQRQAMFEQLAPIFVPLMMRQFENQYDKFMAMSPDEQRRELDKRIDEMQRRGGAALGAGRPGGGGGFRGNVDPKRMAEFQKKWLAWTTPDQRAKMDNGMQVLVNRMKERGMSPPPMPGNGFF